MLFHHKPCTADALRPISLPLPMARKRSKLDLLQSPPPASSSEQSSSHEDEEESSSEDLTPQPKPAAEKPRSSSSGSESESDSEAELVASKPVAQAATSKAPTPAAAAKRPAETQPGKRESKKSNQGLEKTVRVWIEEEEIAILKGMIDYAKKIGSSPTSDMEAFHAFVKKSLHADASRSQLYHKVRRLRNKYREKVMKDESVSSSWNAHEKKLFDLSKKIWLSGMLSPKTGSKAVASLPPKELQMSPTPNDTQEMEYLAKDHLLDKNLGNGDVESYVMGKGLDLIEGLQRAELEERWANLHKAQLKVFVERTQLILDQAKLVLAAHK